MIDFTLMSNKFNLNISSSIRKLNYKVKVNLVFDISGRSGTEVKIIANRRRDRSAPSLSTSKARRGHALMTQKWNKSARVKVLFIQQRNRSAQRVFVILIELLALSRKYVFFSK
jgi:hypothetical protein